MSVTQQQVLDCLAKVMSPRGVPLTNANVLSAITVTDGKVFFSINVDAAEARAWESVRAQAENAVRGIPGVSVAMIALTAERKAGSGAAPSPRPTGGVQPASTHRHPHPPGAQSPMARQAEIPGIAAVIAVPPARAGSASRPRRSILRSACVTSACASGCSTPTSMARRCRG